MAPGFPFSGLLVAGAVAVGGLALRRDRGEGTVGVGGDLPAEAVDVDVVVCPAEQAQIAEASRAALAAGVQVVWFALAGGAVAAAGPLALAVAEDDGAAQVVRDMVGIAEVEGEGRAAERAAELLGAQEPGEAVGAGQRLDGHGQQGALQGEAGLARQSVAAAVSVRAVCIQPNIGHGADDIPVRRPGHHRGDVGGAGGGRGLIARQPPVLARRGR